MGKFSKKAQYYKNLAKSKAKVDEHKLLEDKIKDLNEEEALNFTKFTDYPISKVSIKGLHSANYLEPTEIQSKSLPLTLKGFDLLGAAKTGSGKTLAFILPILERLNNLKWSKEDGLGALIISPTRELAIQIFQVLRKVGKYHSFSAGVIVGGKDVKEEKDRISKMNILVCTPGRMLQHLQESPEFDPDQLQMLVLDEADRILDLGFSKTLDAILDFLPKSRQTLLFSATQTKSVSALARLSLKDPKYVGVYQHSELSIPENLNHNYMVCDLPNKLNVLYSFIKTHLQSKAIVFVSACKQVRFIFETFCKLQPGVPLMQLHGRQKQFKRLEVYEKFTQSNNAFLFCTDIAARGLDFPAVDWVIQLDCPENAETYVHRVGRTARYTSSGNALMFLCPSEEKGMLAQLEKVKIAVDKIEARSSQIKSIQPQLQSFCFQDPEIKYLGQRAFISYLKSVYVQKDKDTFDVHKLPVQEYSHSLGLPGAPNIKFSKKKKTVEKVESEDEDEKANGAVDQEDSDDEEAENDDEPKTSASNQPKTKMEKLFAKKNTTILADHYNKLVDHENVADEEDDFITLKREDHQLEGDSSSESDSELPKLDPSEMTKRQIQKAKKKALKERPKAERLIFDDEGEAHALYELEDGIEFQEKNDIKAIQSQYVQQEGEKLAQEDIEDKKTAKEKRKAKRLAQKLRAKGEDAEDGVVAMLPSDAEDESDSESDESSGSDSESESSESEASDDDKIIVDYRRNNKRTLEEEEEEARKKANILEISEPQTLEEQEALALKLLQG